MKAPYKRMIGLLVLLAQCVTISGNYLGCYTFNESSWTKTVTTYQTKSCISVCTASNFTYVGLKDHFCSCSSVHNYNKEPSTDIDPCDITLNGGENGTCSGEACIGVSSVCPQGHFRRSQSDICGNECHCESDTICDFDTGRCQWYPCALGWSGPACETRDCSNNNGGCEQICSNKECKCGTNYQTHPTNHSACIERCSNIERTNFPKCSDKDDCQNAGHCRKCINVDGSYECECHQGFTFIDGSGCTDIDECQNAPHCRTCKNLPGSYECECHQGFTWVNGHGCTDIDECQDARHCRTCKNLPGTYECECHQGFTWVNGDGCTDIDECQDARNCRFCRNMVGSYECECHEGFTWVNGDGCKDGTQSGQDGSTTQAIIMAVMFAGISFTASIIAWHCITTRGQRPMNERTQDNIELCASPLSPRLPRRVSIAEYYKGIGEYADLDESQMLPDVSSAHALNISEIVTNTTDDSTSV